MENIRECCLANILKVIDVLQRNAEDVECLEEGCTRPFLGNGFNCVCFNTRPVTFYTKDGSILELPFTSDEKEEKSSVFRVEKVKDCCVTVQILKENPNPTEFKPFIATNQFATINLECICVLQCLTDVIVDNV